MSHGVAEILYLKGLAPNWSKIIPSSRSSFTCQHLARATSPHSSPFLISPLFFSQNFLGPDPPLPLGFHHSPSLDCKQVSFHLFKSYFPAQPNSNPTPPGLMPLSSSHWLLQDFYDTA